MVLTICFTRKDARLRENSDHTSITVIEGKEYLQVEHDIQSISTCGSMLSMLTGLVEKASCSTFNINMTLDKPMS